MADDRVQVDDGYAPRQFGFDEQLDTPAAPVDTYVRPAQPAPSSLHGLAEALSGFSQDLKGYLGKRQAIQDQRDTANAQAAAYENNGAAYADAVKSGKLATYNSPVFVQSYKEAQGAILGKRLASGALDAYQTWPGRNSGNPQDFDNFMGDYIKQNLGQISDPDVLKGALPFVHSTSDALYSQNEKDRSDQLMQSSINTHIASTSMNVDNEMDVSLTQSRAPDYNALWSSMMADRQAALASGIRADDYDKHMVDMIHSKSLEYMDPGILGMLKNKVPGQTYSYDDIDGSKATQDTLDTMASRQATLDRAKAEAQAKQDKQNLQDLTGQVVQQLTKDPSAPIPQDIIDQAVKYGDGSFGVHVREWQDTLSKPQPEDPVAIMHIQQQLINGGGLQVITDNLGGTGAIHSPETLTKLLSLANSSGMHEDTAITNNGVVKKSLEYLQQAFSSTDPTQSGALLSPDAVQAQSDFILAMGAWHKANPNATEGDIIQESNKVLKDMQGSITQQQGNKYVRPEAITNDMATAPANDASGNPNSDQTPTKVAPPALTNDAAGQVIEDAGKAAAGASNPPANPWLGDKPPALNQLPQDQQDKINARAESAGVSPDEYIKELWGQRDSFNQKPQPPAPTPSSTGDPNVNNADLFKNTAFQTYYNSVKGLANQTRFDNATGLKTGNPADPAWQKANIVSVNMGGHPVQVNKAAATAFQGFVNDLQAEGYNIHNIGGFNVRNSRDGNSLSEHAYGTAIDINGEAVGQHPAENQFGDKLVTNLPANVSQLAAKWGLSWGGDWHSKKDAMHFEYTGKKTPFDFITATGTGTASPAATKDPLFANVDVSKLPAGMQNNNPGNIKFFAGNHWQGQVGPSRNTDQGDPQVVFDSSADGMRAAAKLALAKFHTGLDTVRKMITTANVGWTPGYLPGAQGVAAASGLGLDQKLNLNDPAQLAKLLRGIVTQEHGPSSKLYTDDLIAKAVQSALT